MHRGTTFWAIVLILAGIILLLSNLGILNANVWSLIWPLFLIALGVWVLLGATVWRGRTVEVEQAAIPLEGVARARVRIQHGAGRLSIDASAPAGMVAGGSFSGGLASHVRHSGDLLDVNLRVPDQAAFMFIPFSFGSRGALDWTLGLTREVPLALVLETGAGEARLDLSELKVTDLELKTGASSTQMTLPANAGLTRVRVESGAASVRLRVPAGVAGRIRIQSGLAGIDVDTSRFPRSNGGYQSPDFDSAQNKADIDVETGVASISIR